MTFRHFLFTFYTYFKVLKNKLICVGIRFLFRCIISKLTAEITNSGICYNILLLLFIFCKYV